MSISPEVIERCKHDKIFLNLIETLNNLIPSWDESSINTSNSELINSKVEIELAKQINSILSDERQKYTNQLNTINDENIKLKENVYRLEQNNEDINKNLNEKVEQKTVIMLKSIIDELNLTRCELSKVEEENHRLHELEMEYNKLIEKNSNVRGKIGEQSIEEILNSEYAQTKGVHSVKNTNISENDIARTHGMDIEAKLNNGFVVKFEVKNYASRKLPSAQITKFVQEMDSSIGDLFFMEVISCYQVDHPSIYIKVCNGKPILGFIRIHDGPINPIPFINTIIDNGNLLMNLRFNQLDSVDTTVPGKLLTSTNSIQNYSVLIHELNSLIQKELDYMKNSLTNYCKTGNFPNDTEMPRKRKLIKDYK